MKPNETALLRELSDEEITEMSASCPLRQKRFLKNERVLAAGTLTRELGLVLSGSVIIESLSGSGERVVLSRIAAGQAFAETYAICGEQLAVDVTAAEDSEIAFLDLKSVLDPLGGSWRDKLIKRLLIISAQKNLVLSERIFCASPKSARGKISAYLRFAAVKSGRAEFDIPFDRQQLADHLGLERSALSRELGRMRDDGLIEFKKSHFCLTGLD